MCTRQAGAAGRVGRQRPTLLTLQRVNNVGVFMSSLKLTAAEAVAAIMACCGAGEVSTITLQIAALVQIRPGCNLLCLRDITVLVYPLGP